MAAKQECSICLSCFTKPKIIPCYHTFCEACLEDHVSKSTNGSHFPCPLCRKTIPIPEGGVENFSNNFYIEDPKSGDGAGNTSSLSKSNDSSIAKPPAIRSPPMSICSQHEMEVNLFCLDCRLSICYKCFLLDHNGHKFRDLQEMTADTVQQIQEVMETLEHVSLGYDNFESLVSTVNSSIDSQTDKLCNEIRIQADAVCKEVKSIAEKMVSDVKKEHRAKKGKLKNLAKRVVETRPAFKKSVDVVEGRSELELLELKRSLEAELKKSKHQDLTVPTQQVTTFTKSTINPKELKMQIGRIEFDTISETEKSESLIFNFKLCSKSKITFVKLQHLNKSVKKKSYCEWRGHASIDKCMLKLNVSRNISFTGLPVHYKIKLLNNRFPVSKFCVEGTLQPDENIIEWPHICHHSILKDKDGGYLCPNNVFGFEVMLRE